MTRDAAGTGTLAFEQLGLCLWQRLLAGADWEVLAATQLGEVRAWRR